MQNQEHKHPEPAAAEQGQAKRKTPRQAQKSTGRGRRLYTVYLDAEQLSALGELAADARTTVAAQIRTAIDWHVAPVAMSPTHTALSDTQVAKVFALTQHMPVDATVSERLDAVLSWF